jgi:hypothetical protein
MSKPKTFKVAKCDFERTSSIQQQIFVIRGHRVMVDSDLANLYGVTTKRLNEQPNATLVGSRKTSRFASPLQRQKNLQL